MSKDHEEFLTELVRHIGATLEQYEVDNNILLNFSSEIDLAYDRTLFFKLADTEVAPVRTPLKLEENDNE